jgi:hypothetical protein
MTPLRQRMLQDKLMRNLSPHTRPGAGREGLGGMAGRWSKPGTRRGCGLETRRTSGDSIPRAGSRGFVQ